MLGLAICGLSICSPASSNWEVSVEDPQSIGSGPHSSLIGAETRHSFSTF